uniref:Coatomer subunit zeta-1-like n=1 Tax=Rhizophora mucronata TaxID=61149 RepID=A0A2P2KAC4_RHIMU
MILETDANVIAGKVAINSMDPNAPLSEQVLIPCETFICTTNEKYYHAKSISKPLSVKLHFSHAIAFGSIPYIIFWVSTLLQMNAQIYRALGHWTRKLYYGHLIQWLELVHAV